MKKYFLSIVLVLFFSSSNVVCATFEGELNPDDIVKWDTVRGKIQGDKYFAVKKPNSNATVRNVVTCSIILSTDSNGISTLKLVAYSYNKGKDQYVFVLDENGVFKKVSKEKAPKEYMETEDSETVKKVPI